MPSFLCQPLFGVPDYGRFHLNDVGPSHVDGSLMPKWLGSTIILNIGKKLPALEIIFYGPDS